MSEESVARHFRNASEFDTITRFAVETRQIMINFTPASNRNYMFCHRLCCIKRARTAVEGTKTNGKCFKMRERAGVPLSLPVAQIDNMIATTLRREIARGEVRHGNRRLHLSRARWNDERSILAHTRAGGFENRILTRVLVHILDVRHCGIKILCFLVGEAEGTDDRLAGMRDKASRIAPDSLC